MSLSTELERRNVLRVTVAWAYAGVAIKERMDREEGFWLARADDLQGMLEQYERAFAAVPENPLSLGIMAQHAGRVSEPAWNSTSWRPFGTSSAT